MSLRVRSILGWKSLLGTVVTVIASAALIAATLSPGPISAAEPRSAGMQQQDGNNSELVRNVVFAIHGGAGTIRREDMTPEQERRYREALTRAVRTGYEAIEEERDSTAAVEAAISTMEDSPLFNAGKGAVFTTDAQNALDASLMDGETLDAGAVTGVKHIKNPISFARELMNHSRHVLLSGRGAELYAQHRGFKLVTQDYFFTERRWESLMRAKNGESDFEFGETNTVGAVGLDRDGNLAAGTSTGGLTNKPVGRIGDSPIIGAGTYANSETVAASATGTGELFIRQAVTHDISAQIEYKNRRVDRAAEYSIDKTEQIGGDNTGGVIALDRNKNLAFVFNTSGMYRGYATEDGDIVVKIFADE